MSDQKLSVNESIKGSSDYLRGSLQESLANEVTGAISSDDTQVSKFHGIYQQDNRDIRIERDEQKLEPLYSFMLRARIPGGVCTAGQWLAVDKIANEFTDNQMIRLTTRQTFQYHGILKKNLKPVMKELNAFSMDSIAACGDVNRNVMCNPNPINSEVHKEVYEWSIALSEALLPKTNAYAEIWLDKKKIEVEEPLYGPTYLPRKFKIAVAIPPHNDVDILTNCLGFTAIIKEKRLIGFNVSVGGGMGTTHGDKRTYPRLADMIGFVEKDNAIKVAETVLMIQRDWGDRHERKLSRLKYTIESYGIEIFRKEVEIRSGVKMKTPIEIEFTTRGDRFGWVKGENEKWNLTLYVECGRIKDTAEQQLQTCLREIAKEHCGDYRMTANQNIIIANVPSGKRDNIERMLAAHSISIEGVSVMRQHSIACVSMPTCALGMAEAERYFPEFAGKVDVLLKKYGMSELPIVLRMTGCPNGCARPFNAEIGLVGKAPGKYNLYLGAAFNGTRMSKMVAENIGESAILANLESRFQRYSEEAENEEHFGNFLIRTKQVQPVLKSAIDFHPN